MKNHQLPLIDALSIDRIADSGASRSTRKFAGTNDQTHLAALLALLRNALPSEQLSRIAHPTAVTNFVEELRQLGLELLPHRVPVVGLTDCVAYADVYALTPADVRRINRWFAKTGGVYA